MSRRPLLLCISFVLTLTGCTHGRGIRLVSPRTEAESASDMAAVAAIRSAVAVEAFEAGTFAHGGREMAYRLLRPADAEEGGRRYPLVVIFHGSGAIGTDNVAQIGPLAKSWATPAMRSRYPAFVLVPQFSARSAEYEHIDTAAATSRPTDLLGDALALVERMRGELPVDPDGVYAIGFSMGGSAVWNALVARPGLFSAAVAVAGVPNRAALTRLGTTRFLLVHGDADHENPFTATRAVYAAAPKRQVELWQYESLAHDFPLDLITGPALAEWLFEEPRPVAR